MTTRSNISSTDSFSSFTGSQNSASSRRVAQQPTKAQYPHNTRHHQHRHHQHPLCNMAQMHRSQTRTASQSLASLISSTAQPCPRTRGATDVSTICSATSHHQTAASPLPPECLLRHPDPTTQTQQHQQRGLPTRPWPRSYRSRGPCPT